MIDTYIETDLSQMRGEYSRQTSDVQAADIENSFEVPQLWTVRDVDDGKRTEDPRHTE